ncbi:MAG TPA: hypothetical protein VGL47_15815 [Amycolatopsis sp.]|uniref:Uncharacterized protein n=1 Tax=Amycolatopsis nalaikhensis TaxID=715472 RepID=A0ABY8XY50_9PSEU|nr:hypothetical protein [Amycolatopsis sp. 2-2]WIV60538.1 hypothetical protein QP939_19005 [Amycolatopsis sp. 2-2]
MRRLLWAAGLGLLPWIAVLGMTLPDVVAAQHWRLAWTGFDAAEALGLLATAWLLGRDDPRTPLIATATATLLLADAWFDVVTAGDDVVFSLLMAALEVPLAAACLAVARPAVRAHV